MHVQSIDSPLTTRAAPSRLPLRRALLVAVIGLGLLLVGCTSDREGVAEPAAADLDQIAAQNSPEGPKVWFVGLEDGATVPPIVELEFGHSDYVIEPVGDGMIHEGAGHFHIGVDTECLAPGIVIPTADPWIHFGDGSNMIELTLEPGAHKLALQVGDGAHVTLDDPGLCHVINVTVQEEAG